MCLRTDDNSEKTVAKEVMSSSVVKVNGHVVPDCFATSTKSGAVHQMHQW